MNADQNKTTTNVSMERRVVAYLPPKYHLLFSNYVKYQELSESASMTDIVRKFFDTMPEPERQKILNYSKNSY